MNRDAGRRRRSSVTLCVVVTNDSALGEALVRFNRHDRFVVVQCIAAHLAAFLESFSVTHVVLDVRHVSLDEITPLLGNVVSATGDSSGQLMSLVEGLMAERMRPLASE